MNKSRLEAFSDGVFGFAITLLVLGVQVPTLRTINDAELRFALLQALSQLVPYVTSFATIGIIWLNHHAMFQPVERVEHTTLTLNLLLLLVVTFIPYPTAVLSRYGALPSSAFLYGCTLTALGIAYSLLWRHIVRGGLSSVTSGTKQTRMRFRRNLAGSLTYPAAALIALRFPRVSIAIYFVVAIYYFIPSDRSAEPS
jgi:TMEM175 potassium channel family protein